PATTPPPPPTPDAAMPARPLSPADTCGELDYAFDPDADAGVAGFDSCVFELTPIPSEPEELLLIVETASGVRMSRRRDAGWSVTPDHTAVVLTGSLCEEALSGALQRITFEYKCRNPPPKGFPPLD
ncbi:MAG: hypothetical protein OXR73_03780, partial [Myxococcales bacterium]|nr:hypothetical protein [Myxococcales bacterium]